MKTNTLLVTDSGLGGLSVFAGMAERLALDARYDRIRLIYFNAWPRQYKGYNHYPDRDARAQIFHNAMAAMGKYHPDHIYIACNTLSVIYPFTRFARETKIPVTGIVEHGVDMIREALTCEPDSRAVIFGTPTTIQENSHKRHLTALGIPGDRIVTQGCLNLAGKIERDPFGPEVEQMIDENARAAAARLGKMQGSIHAALCCTHFGYRRDLFQKALERHTGAPVNILNPNDEMVDRACSGAAKGERPEITMEILSRVTWEPSRIAAYRRLLSPLSPGTVDALERYKLNKKLFSIDTD